MTDQCENNLLGLTLKSACCCSAIGLAWGSPCEKCNPSEDCGGCPPGMAMLDGKKWYFVFKIVLTYCETKSVLVVEKNFRRFDTECSEFAKSLISVDNLYEQ